MRQSSGISELSRIKARNYESLAVSFVSIFDPSVLRRDTTMILSVRISTTSALASRT